jgi:hypothetical protein
VGFADFFRTVLSSESGFLATKSCVFLPENVVFPLLKSLNFPPKTCVLPAKHGCVLSAKNAISSHQKLCSSRQKLLSSSPKPVFFALRPVFFALKPVFFALKPVFFPQKVGSCTLYFRIKKSLCYFRGKMIFG